MKEWSAYVAEKAGQHKRNNPKNNQRCHVMHFLTLMRVFSRFLHTSFLSVDIMSDFVISTRYLLKKSGYVHLKIPQYTLINVHIPVFGW